MHKINNAVSIHDYNNMQLDQVKRMRNNIMNVVGVTHWLCGRGNSNDFSFNDIDSYPLRGLDRSIDPFLCLKIK